MRAELAGGRRNPGLSGILTGIILTALAAVLGACARSPDLLLLLDPYAEALMREEGILSQAGMPGLGWVGRIAARAGIRVEVLEPGEGSSEASRRLVARFSPRGVYVSPLLAQAGIALASEFPGTLVFLDGPLPSPGSPQASNLRILQYDLAGAYGEAAASLRDLLSLPELPPPLSAAYPGESPARGVSVGILSARPDKSAQRRLQRFRDTLGQGEQPVTVVHRELDSLEDRANARRSIERLREQGVGVFLLQVSTLTGFCLEVLQKEGGLAVVESAAGIEAYSDVLLLTLERDFPVALTEMRAQAAGRQGAAGQGAGGPAAEGPAAAGPVEAGSIRVPVRLRWWNLPQEETEGDE
ncbi:MAG: hypothetical protein JW820_11580 [Spirochaetales bacterium]|nr:hypothetical protein [Spirochaetales bacterium]